MKKLIVYYSFEGRTEALSKVLAEVIDAEILAIKPVKEHKSKGFTKFIWGGSMQVMNRRPKLEAYDFNPSDYDLIIFAGPVWAGSIAPPLKVFLENEDILAKKVAYFFTHQGGQGKTRQHFEELLENNHIIASKEFVTLNVELEVNKKDMLEWAEELKDL